LPGTKYILSIYLAVAQRKNEKKKKTMLIMPCFSGKMTFIVKEIAMTGQKLAPTMREKCSISLGGKQLGLEVKIALTGRPLALTRVA
jgi:hypothetical protein